MAFKMSGWSAFTKQVGGGTKKVCLPKDKVMSMSQEERDNRNHQQRPRC